MHAPLFDPDDQALTPYMLISLLSAINHVCCCDIVFLTRLSNRGERGCDTARGEGHQGNLILSLVKIPISFFLTMLSSHLLRFVFLVSSRREVEAKERDEKNGKNVGESKRTSVKTNCL